MENVKDFGDLKTPHNRLGLRWKVLLRKLVDSEVITNAIEGTVIAIVGLCLVLAVYVMLVVSKRAELDYMTSLKVAQTINAIK